MPREQKKRLKGQQQTYAQQTFDFTVPHRQGAARPVDPYEQQFVSSGAKNMLDFVENVRSTGRKAVQANEIFKGKKREEGAAAARRGEEVTGNEHFAFLEGYENLNGEVSVGDYRNKTAELLSKSEDMTPEEFRASLDSLFVDSINGRSDAFIEGFFPKAKYYEEQAVNSYQKVQREKFLKENNTKLTAKFSDDLAIIYSKDNELSFTERAEELHKSLVKQQEFAVKYKIGSKSDVSRVFVDTLINKAIISGNPQLLDAFTIQDKDGIRLMDVDEFSTKIGNAKIRAENVKEANENAKEEANKDATKKLSEKLQRTIHKAIVDNDMAAARQDILTYEDYLPPNVFGKLLREVDKGTDESSFGEYTNADTHRNMYNKACYGELTPDDFRLNRMSLTKSDYIQLGEVNARAKASIAKSGSRPQYMRKADEYKNLLKTLVTGDSFVNLYKLPEKQKIARATHLWNMAIQEELEKNGSENLNFEFFDKTMNKIVKSITSGEDDKNKAEKKGGFIGSEKRDAEVDVLPKYN